MSPLSPLIWTDFLDPAALDQLLEIDDDGGMETMKELVEMFLRSGPQKIANLKSNIAQKDRKGVAGEAHALKSSAAYLGAHKLSKELQEVETAAPAGSIVELETKIDEITTYFHSVVLALELALAEYTQKIAKGRPKD